MKKTVLLLVLIPALALFGFLAYVIFADGAGDAGSMLGPNTVAYIAGVLVVLVHVGGGYAAYSFFRRAAQQEDKKTP